MNTLSGKETTTTLLHHLNVAGYVFDGVFFVLPFFPRDVLDETLNLTESVSEVFPTYS